MPKRTPPMIVEIPKGKIYGSEGIDPIVGFCIIDLITNMNRKDVVIKPRIIDFNVFVLPNRNKSLNDDAKHSLLLCNVIPAITEKIQIIPVTLLIEFK